MIADGHKWLNVPYDCGFAFVKDASLQPSIFGEGAAYLPALDDPKPNWGYLGPEMSRRCRAFAVWATLRAYGRNGHREIVERSLDLAERLAATVDEAEDLERLAEVPLNIVCFRAHPPEVSEDRLDELNRRIAGRVIEDGRVFFGATTYDGKAAFRPAPVNYRNRAEDIDDRSGRSGARRGARSHQLLQPPSPGTVDVRPMMRSENEDPSTLLVELVDDDKGRVEPPEARQLSSKMMSDADRVHRERTDEELDDAPRRPYRAIAPGCVLRTERRQAPRTGGASPWSRYSAPSSSASIPSPLAIWARARSTPARACGCEDFQGVLQGFQIVWADRHRSGAPIPGQRDALVLLPTSSTISERWALISASGRVRDMTMIVVTFYRWLHKRSSPALAQATVTRVTPRR